MKTSLAFIVALTSVFAFTQAANAQCDCQETVTYYAPVETTAYYAPTTTYYVPTTTYYAPTTAYYAPTTAYNPTSAYYAPTTAYYGGGGYYGRVYNSSYYRGGLFGTGLGGWAGVRGVDRRWDRRGW